MSLAQLNDRCNEFFGEHMPQPDTRPRPFDIPWFVMDNELVQRELGWMPKRSLDAILEEIRAHVSENPNWLARCGVA